MRFVKDKTGIPLGFRASIGLLALFLIYGACPVQAEVHAPPQGHETQHVAPEHGEEATHPEHGDEEAKTHDAHPAGDVHSEPAAHAEHVSEDSHAEQAGHGAAPAEHGEKHGAAGAHGQGHHAPPPFVYYLNWEMLGFAFIIVCFYCLWVYKKGKPKHEGLFLAALLVFMAIALYVTNQFPEVQRHFDAASHQFVDGYHEAAGMGFIKFIYKMGLGVLLTVYGIMGREDHH